MKKCPKCKKVKPLTEFFKNKSQSNGHQSYCKSCVKKYYKKVKPTYFRDFQRKYRWKYQEKRNEWERNQRTSDPKFKLNKNIGRQIRFSLNGKKAGEDWENLVGYTLKQLKQRLECQFKKRMSWSNYGKWHIDHKKPKSLFNYNSAEDRAFRDCWSLANLQPLWAKENFSKNNKFLKFLRA